MGKQRSDLAIEARDKPGNRCEVRGAVTAQGDKGDVLAAGALNGPAADDALAVGLQHDLEQQGRRIGRRARPIIAVALIKAGEIELVVNQVVQRVLKTTRKKLSLKINREKARAGVNVLIAGHIEYPICNTHWIVDIPIGSRQHAQMNRDFLQPR